MGHPNTDILRGIDDAMLSGDLDKFFAYFTDDVVLHISGSSALAGVHKGKEQMQEVFGRFQTMVGEYSFEAHAYLADDEHGVAMQKSKAVRDGQTLELDEVFVVHFRDGQVSEMWYLPTDQAAIDAWMG
jgi:hypothetical protein